MSEDNVFLFENGVGQTAVIGVDYALAGRNVVDDDGVVKGAHRFPVAFCTPDPLDVIVDITVDDGGFLEFPARAC